MSTSVEMSDSVAARPYHHGDLRRALVLAATELAARHGPDGAAQRVPVSSTA